MSEKPSARLFLGGRPRECTVHVLDEVQHNTISLYLLVIGEELTDIKRSHPNEVYRVDYIHLGADEIRLA